MLSALILSSLVSVGLSLTQDLGGHMWTTVSSNGSVSCPSIVPGGIYTDLWRAGFISDPYFRDNDLLYKWIGRDSWNFSRTFQVDDNLLSKSKVVLVCHGLDTVSEIWVNGIKVGATDNMFVRHTFDIKSLLKGGEDNTILVSFRSSVEVAKERHEAQSSSYVIPPTCPLPVQNGECHINYLRKIQSSFSWDWGPSFPSQGIWKKIELEAFDSVTIRDVTVSPRPYTLDNWSTSSWELDIRVFLDRRTTSGSTSGHLKVNLRGQIVADLNQTLPEGQTEVMLQFRVRLPQDFEAELWWPNGYGEQALYDITVSYQDFVSTETMTSKVVRVGFRTVELIQGSIANSTGLSFYIQVNGVPIFGKGSNWIPADAFPERSIESRVRDLLESVVAANMNMLRVWGGGAYETDAFYNIADELGILIWQDLMFACSLYPSSQDFLGSVALEVKQQIRRLQHHPSIFLWAGNNENEAAIAQAWWPAVLQTPKQFHDDYLSLYVTTLRPLVLAEDPDRPYLSSSPSNGPETQKEGWISADPQSEFYGDGQIKLSRS